MTSSQVQAAKADDLGAQAVSKELGNLPVVEDPSVAPGFGSSGARRRLHRTRVGPRRQRSDAGHRRPGGRGYGRFDRFRAHAVADHHGRLQRPGVRQLTTLTSALLDPLLAADPVGPRITYYDDATGERIELSTVTLANWAAKTGNLLRDELGAGPGSRVAVLLPPHWQTAAVLFGIWWIGAEVVLTRSRRHRAVHRRPVAGRRRCRRRGRGRGAVPGPVRQAGRRPARRRHRLRDVGTRARRPDLARTPAGTRAGRPVSGRGPSQPPKPRPPHRVSPATTA